MTTLIDACLKKFGTHAGIARALRNLRRRSRYEPVEEKSAYLCVGGPLDGETLWLTSASTSPFALQGRRGRYVGERNATKLTWEEL